MSSEQREPRRYTRHFKREAVRTAIPTQVSWLSLAAILDVFARYVVGWAMEPRRDEQLVLAALQMALARRRPGPDCCITPTGAVSTPAAPIRRRWRSTALR